MPIRLTHCSVAGTYSPAMPVVEGNAWESSRHRVRVKTPSNLRVEGQDEVDHYWDLLAADGGEPGQCGWCKDKYGVSWQVIPRELESSPATTAPRPTIASAGRC